MPRTRARSAAGTRAEDAALRLGEGRRIPRGPRLFPLPIDDRGAGGPAGPAHERTARRPTHNTGPAGRDGVRPAASLLSDKDLGEIVEGCGTPQEATRRLEEEARRRPGDATILCLAGIANMEIGNLEKAMRLLRESLHVFPRLAPAHAAMGRTCAKMGRHKRAAACCKRP